MTTLSEEQKELLKNWKQRFINHYASIGCFAFFHKHADLQPSKECLLLSVEEIIALKDLEAEQKVEIAIKLEVGLERRRCANLIEEFVNSNINRQFFQELQKKILNLEPPKD